MMCHRAGPRRTRYRASTNRGVAAPKSSRGRTPCWQMREVAARDEQVGEQRGLTPPRSEASRGSRAFRRLRVSPAAEACTIARAEIERQFQRSASAWPIGRRAQKAADSSTTLIARLSNEPDGAIQPAQNGAAASLEAGDCIGAGEIGWKAGRCCPDGRRAQRLPWRYAADPAQSDGEDETLHCHNRLEL